jgi:LysM repeat protein
MRRFGFLGIGLFLTLLLIPAAPLFADVVAIPGDSERAAEEQSLGESPEAEELPQATGTQPFGESDQPRRHVVKRGDTLWSISNSYLIDPFYWPRVWGVNPFIKNPDLIYPGNVIMLPPPGALMIPPPPSVMAKAPEVTLPPSLPPARITVQPQPEPVLDPAMLASVGYVLSDEIGNPGILIAAQDNKVLVGERDTVYIKPGRKMDPVIGDELVIYRNIRKIYHPKTKKYLGDLIVLLGVVEVFEVNKKVLSGKVLKSYNYILTGDPVAPYDAVHLPIIEKIPATDQVDVRGFVVDVKEEKVSIGQYDVVYIDKGIVDGIGPGSSFRVIRDGEKTPFYSVGRGVTLPSRTIGELEVITVGDRTATAKVLMSSEPINRGDRIETLSTQE